MFNKNTILLFFVLCFTNLVAQTKNNEWQVGVGVGVTKFSDENALFIGDRYQFQIPVINITKPISDHLAFDVAFSANTFDTSFIGNNNISYVSLDTSFRYFYDVADTFFPYVFAGGSFTDTDYGKIAPTLNVGAGGTIWINEIFGLNAQVYYKYPLNSDNMKSHIQITAGMVFALNIFDLFSTGSISNGFCR